MRRQKLMGIGLGFLEHILKSKGGNQPTISSNIPDDLRIIEFSHDTANVILPTLYLVVESAEFDEVPDNEQLPVLVVVFFADEGLTAASEQARIFARDAEYAHHGPVLQRCESCMKILANGVCDCTHVVV